MTAYEKYVEARGDKYTDYKVAKSTGLSPVVFSEWKRGKCEPKIDKRIKIAEFLGVPVEQLVGDPK